MRLLGAALAAAVALGPGIASAQERRGGAAGEFDFYVLALSWAPGFCELEGREKEREDCEPGRSLGFVVHGLWPQFERGYPSECGPQNRFVPREAARAGAEIFRSEGLARYQWRKHGTCSGDSPSAYFADVKKAAARVAIPERFANPREDARLAPLEIERAFADANPGLRTDMMSVACRRGVLQEVRICLSRDLRSFRTCPQVDRSGCRGGSVEIGAPR